MAKHNPANERIKRAYFIYLREARRRNEASVDGVAKALARFEVSTGYRDFAKFHREQAVSFKRKLDQQTGERTGERLSRATVNSTLSALRTFFIWLADQPGYKRKISYSDADYFNLSEKDVRELPSEATPVPVLVILDEFARLGRASVLASAFSYVAGYGIRLLPVIQSRSQLRGVYGEHLADEIVANCGVEVAFTPKELRVANELSDRIGYVGQESVTRSLTIHGLLANRSKSISEQRRALLLPQELMQFPTDRLLLLRGGIPPIIGTKIFYYKSRFFKKRAFPPPVVPTHEKRVRPTMAPPPFRDMTDEEAEGNPAHPLMQDDIRTEDYPSFCADLLTLDRHGNASIIIEEGNENG